MTKSLHCTSMELLRFAETLLLFLDWKLAYSKSLKSTLWRKQNTSTIFLKTWYGSWPEYFLKACYVPAIVGCCWSPSLGENKMSAWMVPLKHTFPLTKLDHISHWILESTVEQDLIFQKRPSKSRYISHRLKTESDHEVTLSEGCVRIF